MTPREKAYNLCMTFLMETDIDTKKQAKKCALICVEEILNEIDLSHHIHRDYWYSVEQEIKRLRLLKK